MSKQKRNSFSTEILLNTKEIPVMINCVDFIHSPQVKNLFINFLIFANCRRQSQFNARKFPFLLWVFIIYANVIVFLQTAKESNRKQMLYILTLTM